MTDEKDPKQSPQAALDALQKSLERLQQVAKDADNRQADKPQTATNANQTPPNLNLDKMPDLSRLQESLTKNLSGLAEALGQLGQLQQGMGQQGFNLPEIDPDLQKKVKDLQASPDQFGNKV
ncbi:MAG: hypothetical protein LBI43_04005 [Streptococcaceae bacterium]|jgi:hypothetical protein|nr:hypothetical protein [Streptococcaceae bacterium]